jgi:hypothetical protein
MREAKDDTPLKKKCHLFLSSAVDSTTDLILRSPPEAGVSKDGPQATPRPHGSRRASRSSP